MRCQALSGTGNMTMLEQTWSLAGSRALWHRSAFTVPFHLPGPPPPSLPGWPRPSHPSSAVTSQP